MEYRREVLGEIRILPAADQIPRRQVDPLIINMTEQETDDQLDEYANKWKVPVLQSGFH